ncbi:hypothetical protein WP05_25550, partial [Salmonella enterica subsp. arizonae]|nr:hypothetical protein [Salmonella enterica subsp. arizonae]
MNKVMYGENRRRGGRNMLCRLLRSGRWFLCLALLCSVMLPGFASAATGDFCENLDGSGNINLKLPPSVTLEPGMDKIPSIPPVTVSYRCVAPSLGEDQKRVAIVYKGDGSSFLQALDRLGLTLTVTIIDGGVTSNWTYVPYQNYDEKIYVGVPYKGKEGTGNRTMTIRMSLSQNSSQSAPGFYALPALSAFKLQPYYNQGNGPFLVTPSLRIQYIPKCFVKTSLNKSNVDFGPVITTDVGNSFSRTIPFTVTASVDDNCNGGQFGNLKKFYQFSSTSPKYYLNLPLKVSFMLNNGGTLYSDNKSIILHNPDGNNNGLQLQITGDNGPVTFGDISTSGGTQPPSANQFSEFNGESNTWNVSKTYNAVLTPTGAPVKTGKYSAQVTVKV